MSVVLALGAAVGFGSADFLGGIASRRRTAVSVALGAQAAGLVVLALALPLLGPVHATPGDLAIGWVGGLFGGGGLVLLFRSLARGPMSVIAPVAALVATIVPVLAGLALGERPGGLVVVGIVAALAAIVLITREGPRADAGVVPDPAEVDGVAEADRTDPEVHGATGVTPTRTAPADLGAPGVVPTRATPAVVGVALLAGAMFGLFFVCLHQTDPASGMTPLVAARVASVPLIAALTIGRGGGLRGVLDGRGAGVALLSGIVDMAANVLLLVALRHGLLTVVSATVGLYPVATVLLAQAVLGERLRRPQLGGLVAAVAAATLVSV